MPIDLSLFSQPASVADTMVIYRKAESQGLGKNQFEVREPVNPPLNLRIKAWFSPNTALGRLIGSQAARNKLSDMYKGIDRLFPPLHVTAGLYRALKDEHDEDVARLVTTLGAKQGTGKSKVENMLSYYRRTWAAAGQSSDPVQVPRSDDPSSWRL